MDKVERSLKAGWKKHLALGNKNKAWRLREDLRQYRVRKDCRTRPLFNASRGGRIVKNRMFVSESQDKKLVRACSTMVKGSHNLWS